MPYSFNFSCPTRVNSLQKFWASQVPKARETKRKYLMASHWRYKEDNFHKVARETSKGMNSKGSKNRNRLQDKEGPQEIAQ